MSMSTPVRVLIGLVGTVVVLIVGVVVTGLFLSDHAHMERAIVIDAPQAKVFALLNGFGRFNEWSPWADLDPNTQYHIEGPATGVGAKQSWSSPNEAVGSGSQEIVEAIPDRSIKLKLVFSGFDSDNLATFTLTQEAGGTKVIWANDADFKGNLVGRYFGLMLDSMIGPDYEKGLVRLKALAESSSEAGPVTGTNPSSQ